MTKDIEGEERFGAGALRGLDPRLGHGPKVYGDGNSKSTKVFLDAVWGPLLHVASQFPGETCLDRIAQVGALRKVRSGTGSTMSN